MNYRTERYPVITLSLIGLNTLVYLVSLVFFFGTEGQSNIWIRQHFWLIPNQSVLYTYLTSMFVHAGFFHLLGNMIFLFLFGSCVEDIIGRWRFLIYYLFGGIVAELTYIAMSPDHFASGVPMGGASGAISTCMGIYLLLRADADIEFKYFIWFIYARAGEFETPAWIAISFWFLKDLFWAMLGFVNHNTRGGVAFGAHVGGFLAGFAVAGVYKMIQRNQGEEIPREIISPAAVIAGAAGQREISTNETPTIFLHENGVQSGPFTLSQIQWRFSRNTIGKEALYWSEGMADWQSVLDLAGHPLQ
ncbi:MAG TPA: rhomboid family intramembrane serine protease [Verrucomicrobiae bacterium]